VGCGFACQKLDKILARERKTLPNVHVLRKEGINASYLISSSHPDLSDRRRKLRIEKSYRSTEKNAYAIQKNRLPYQISP
jgi:hypothetical protein